MGPDERRADHDALLAMAEALIAGRTAGRIDGPSGDENPFDARSRPDEHDAWKRGFRVGRSFDRTMPAVPVLRA